MLFLSKFGYGRTIQLSYHAGLPNLSGNSHKVDREVNCIIGAHWSGESFLKF